MYQPSQPSTVIYLNMFAHSFIVPKSEAHGLVGGGSGGRWYREGGWRTNGCRPVWQTGQWVVTGTVGVADG